MKLNFVAEIPESKARKENTELVELLKEFEQSGEKAAELKFDKEHYKDATSFSSTVRGSIERHHISAKVFTRQGRIYLSRT